jgi:hypothetical protein
LELTEAWKRKIDAWRDRRATAVVEALGRLSADDRQLIELARPALARLADELEPSTAPSAA